MVSGVNTQQQFVRPRSSEGVSSVSMRGDYLWPGWWYTLCTADICWGLVILNNAPGDQERGETTESEAWVHNIHSYPSQLCGSKFEVWSWETISPWSGAHKGKGTMEIGEGESNPRPLRSRQSETRIRGNEEEICQDRDKEKEWASTRPPIKGSWEGENLCLRKSLCARGKVVRRKLEPLKWVMSGQTDPGFYPCT